MPSITVNDIQVFFAPDRRDTAQVIASAAAKALRLVADSWGLGEPDSCRIYVMTSWRGFFFQSAPWAWKVLLALSFPIWSTRARRTWPYTAAWTERYGRMVAIGIKPPDLLEASDRRIGRQIYLDEPDPLVKLQHLTCHELTHACSAHLKLPAWLNEGLAMVTVDRFLARPTIRADTLEMLRLVRPGDRPPTYRQLARLDADSIARFTVLGYWLVRYLEDVRSGFLKRILLPAHDAGMLESEIASELGIESSVFWSTIPNLIVTHFERG